MASILSLRVKNIRTIKEYGKEVKTDRFKFRVSKERRLDKAIYISIEWK